MHLALLLLSLKRLRSRPGLTALLILSVALAAAIMVCIPVFANAVSRRMMAEELNARTGSSNRTAFSVRYYAWPTAARPLSIPEATYIRDWLADRLRREIALPIRSVYMHLESPRCRLLSEEGGSQLARSDLSAVRIAYVEHVAQHITVVDGEPFGQATLPNVLNVWVEISYAHDMAMQPGDTLVVSPEFGAGLEPMRMRIAGFFEALAAHHGRAVRALRLSSHG